MKVAIDARILPGVAGGVAVAVKSLLQGLGQLVDGDEEYVVIVHGEEQQAWVASFLGPNQRAVLFGRPQHRGARGLMLRLLRPIARYVRRELDRRVWPEVPVSDGFHESLGCDVLHLPTQGFILCALPTIYNPHDLQHLRYPQFFSPSVLAWRETIYPAGCHFAQTVVVGSQWVKDDVIRRYRIDPDKVQVIPEAAPSQSWAEPSSADLARARATYGLKPPFIVFPGVTWPHKNHLQLFRALAHLRDQRGLTVRLICTGARYPDHWPRIEAGLREFALSGQVKFLGYVPEPDLRAIYRLASCLVLPSFYEASSLPIFEAWFDGLPVVCSNAAALPQQVHDAALLFDPADVNALADALATVMTDADVRRLLQGRGYERLKDFDLQRTAKAYRGVYRRAAGLPLSEEDRWLLRWDWMRGAPQGAS
jgi:glycosyltransferase involved in cell wall biosynthesis